MRWSTRPESVITTSSSRAGVSATTSRWRTDRRRQRRVLHDRDLTGQLRQQPHRAAQHVVEVDAGLEELQDRATAPTSTAA